MLWTEQLPGNHRRGSYACCLNLMSGDRREVAANICQLVDLSDVEVTDRSFWMPSGIPEFVNGVWNTQRTKEAHISKKNLGFGISVDRCQRLNHWWLGDGNGGKKPSWDIACSCVISSKSGLLLVEAKAHKRELSEQDKCRAPVGSKNYEHIGVAIEKANADLRYHSGSRWNLQRDSHYQLCNRFAWSWKLASMGIPVVLIYLGFLDSPGWRDSICSAQDWEEAVKDYSKGFVPEVAWNEKPIMTEGVPFRAVIRSVPSREKEFGSQC